MGQPHQQPAVSGSTAAGRITSGDGDVVVQPGERLGRLADVVLWVGPAEQRPT